ncbi:hypothetical protein HDU86_004532 [Geranomyces michiganensis]|nr:hypothetical protein HDU86_004532 [Geranomyces michiganensis]
MSCMTLGVASRRAASGSWIRSMHAAYLLPHAPAANRRCLSFSRPAFSPSVEGPDAVPAPPAVQSPPSPSPFSVTTSPHPKLTRDANADWARPYVPSSAASAPAAAAAAATTANNADVAGLAAKKKKASYVTPRPIYTPQELAGVKVTHRELTGPRDRVAYALVRLMRWGFDTSTRYSDETGKMTEKQWLDRIVFLETVAGVPGMVGGVVRHLRSLRLLRRDNGWIHTLLAEAENERMHLLSFLKVKQPSIIFRAMVLMTQGIFFNMFFFSYLLSPRTCHRFVGYLEESAVHTYTHCLKDIEAGSITHWAKTPAPEIAREYWQLGENATLKDLVAAVRADESEHRDVNHVLASLKPDDPNPF